jgi:HK97 family phage prohead protease
MTMEHFTSDLCEVKFATGTADGTFSGYGAVFGNIDSHGDRIEKGAFDETLREWRSKGKYPKMLLQHGAMFFGAPDDDLPIGQWTLMEENSKGLKVEGRLFALNTDRGALIYEGLKSGELDGLSIGYRAKKYTMGTKPQDPTRTLHQVDLREVSIVTFPSNDKATIGSVKSALDMLNPRELERELKQFLSGADAVKAVAILKKHLQREAGGHSPQSSRDEDAAVELLDTLKKLRAA